MDKKIGVISQARMSSNRLPGKILMKIKDKTLLEYHLSRLQLAGLNVYLATTDLSSDDIVEDFCTKKNISFFRGSEDDVLARYADTARKFGLDVIVRVTSDCPLIDGQVVKSGIEKYLSINQKNIYYSNCLQRTYPRGLDFEIFSSEMLYEAEQNAKLAYQREHVTPYFYDKNPNITFAHHINDQNGSQYRITVDEPKDLQLIEQMIVKYDAEFMGANQLIELLDQHPELVAINREVEQKKVII